MKDFKLLGFYNYTVVLTYIGMLSGFVGIVYILKGNLLASAMCLMLAGLCDMFDGTVASFRKRNEKEKCFGIQIDSLSDFLCFGVLPALFVYHQNMNGVIAVTVAFLYLLCALIRLAYFNVDEQDRSAGTNEPRKIYYGLPVTVSAIIFPAIFLICNYFSFKTRTVLVCAMAATAVLFVLPFRMKKPGFIGKIFVLLSGVIEFILLVLSGGDI